MKKIIIITALISLSFLSVLANENKTLILNEAITDHEYVLAKIRVLVDQDINTQDEDGFTALIWASAAGYTDIVSALIDIGADDIQNNRGDTALILASYWGHVAIVKILIRAGANVDTKNNNGDTALMLADSRGNVEAVRLLRAANTR